MAVWTQRFNLYLALAAALALPGGCQTHRPKGPVSALRVHIEVKADALGASQAVSMLRSAPVLVTVAHDPFLTEANIVSAKVMDTPGGFAVEIHFNETSAWILEQYSAANPGEHFVIFGQWGDKPAEGRWLAAPLITQRTASGVLSFTPDCSRAEADRLVLGLNNVAAQMRKGQMK